MSAKVLDVDSLAALKNAVLDAITEVYKNDYFLIEQCCHELTVVASFFKFFCARNRIEDNLIKIDLEYSRIGESLEAKPAPLNNEFNKSHMRIDVVIHQRGCQRKNKLALEFKCGERQKDLEWDFEKLKSVTVCSDNPSQVRNYKLGLSLQYNERGVILVPFIGGEEQESEQYSWNNVVKAFIGSTGENNEK